MKASISLKGLDDTVRSFKEFGEAAQNRMIRNAARSGASVARAALKKAAPRAAAGDKSEASAQYGNLRSNIKQTQLRSKNGKHLPYYKVTTGHAFWGGFTDIGTGKHNTAPGPRAKGAAARTHILPNFWWRNTIESIRAQVQQAIIEGCRRSFTREWQKLKSARR